VTGTSLHTSSWPWILEELTVTICWFTASSSMSLEPLQIDFWALGFNGICFDTLLVLFYFFCSSHGDGLALFITQKTSVILKRHMCIKRSPILNNYYHGGNIIVYCFPYLHLLCQTFLTLGSSSLTSSH
jgi:hypothetical protein